MKNDIKYLIEKLFDANDELLNNDESTEDLILVTNNLKPEPKFELLPGISIAKSLFEKLSKLDYSDFTNFNTSIDIKKKIKLETDFPIYNIWYQKVSFYITNSFHYDYDITIISEICKIINHKLIPNILNQLIKNNYKKLDYKIKFNNIYIDIRKYISKSSSVIFNIYGEYIDGIYEDSINPTGTLELSLGSHYNYYYKAKKLNSGKMKFPVRVHYTTEEPIDGQDYLTVLFTPD